MNYPDIDLSAFPKEREAALRQIERYNKFKTMFYRPNLWQHAQRVLWIVESLLPVAQKHVSIDPEKTRALALVHDDPEIITGDIPGDHKVKMTAEEARAQGKIEEEAIRTLASQYPKTLHGYDYEALLLHAQRKDCTEAWVVSYADKLDAYGETMHDLLAGNYLLLWSEMFYVRTLLGFSKKFPEIADLLLDPTSAFTDPKSQMPPNVFEPETYLLFGNSHTPDSVTIKTDFPFYNEWKDIVLARGGKEGMDWLTIQKEFLPTTSPKT